MAPAITKAERFDVGDVYLWTALDQDTKLVASFVVGKGSADNARRLMPDLSRRMVFPDAARATEPGPLSEPRRSARMALRPIPKQLT